MKATKIDPTKGSKKKKGETQPEAAERWRDEAATVRDAAIRDGRMAEASGGKSATQANVLGQEGPMMDTGRNVKGGSKKQVKAAKRRVAKSGASPQAKMSAKRIY